MSKTKQTSLTITHVELTRRHVIIHYLNNTAGIELTEVDAPLPSFKSALNAIADLVIKICHLPAGYVKDLRVRSLTFNDKNQVTIKADKSFDDASAPLTIKTPNRFLATPEEEGEYSPPLKPDQVALLDTLREEAKAYIKGERAQGTLALEDGDEEDKETGGEEEPLLESLEPIDPPEEEIAAVPKKGKKPAKKSRKYSESETE
jgi:hypothetical protein